MEWSLELTKMYIEILLKQVPAELEDLISAVVFDCGGSGIMENLAFSQPEGEEDVFTTDVTEKNLIVYFEKQPDENFWFELQKVWPTAQWEIQTKPDQDWMSEWKKHFKPFALSEDIYVVPSWCEVPSAAKKVITMDPGMAFGTGTHETTQLVAELLHQIVKKHEIKNLLDVGTGTGLLAILATHFVKGPIAVTELDEEARRVARENFVLNKVSDQITWRETDLSAFEESFEMVVANIIDGVLIRLQEELFRKASKYLVVSGIISEREEHFESNFKIPEGWTLVEKKQKGDWLAYAWKR